MPFECTRRKSSDEVGLFLTKGSRSRQAWTALCLLSSSSRRVRKPNGGDAGICRPPLCVATVLCRRFPRARCKKVCWRGSKICWHTSHRTDANRAFPHPPPQHSGHYLPGGTPQTSLPHLSHRQKPPFHSAHGKFSPSCRGRIGSNAGFSTHLSLAPTTRG